MTIRLLTCLLLAPLVLTAQVVHLDLPLETAAFKPAPGSEIANGQCLICHSVEYVTTQPPLPGSFWAASVKKMRDKFGAPLPEAQIEPLVSYLTKHYGVDTNTPAGSAPAGTATASPAPDLPGTVIQGEAIAGKYGCLGCHSASAKLVGPAYKDIAAKYSQDGQAAARISEQIRKGGSGKWGSTIMPPFPSVTDAEIRALAEWILSRK
jgi:cytochrome c551/c552